MNTLTHIKSELIKTANKSNALQMEAYLRNQFLFFGVMSPQRKLILKKLKNQYLNQLTPTEKRDLIILLWNQEYREFQLLALDWMMKWHPNDYIEADIDFLEHLISSKSWWDTVDFLASNLVGKYALKFPLTMNRKLKKWENSKSFWIKRTCLIFQLRYGKDTNLDYLQYLTAKFKKEKEFFIQKAIGWSLREVSKWNPSWVKQLIKEEELNGLARREASKYLIY